MIELLKNAVTDFKMLSGVSHITVALSGGADSVALLHSLNILKNEYDFTLSAAHLNHSLRGEESLRDMNFCKELCKGLCVPLEVKTADVKTLAGNSKESVELAARRVRYEFLEQFCSENAVVATAHTASDNLETMLLNLIRGTAIKGLCGIPPVRDKFIRPLIYCTRQQIEDYCSKNSLKYVTDSTNLSCDYTRNIIRHKVVPVLKSINPKAEQRATVTANSLRSDSDYLQNKADELFSAAYNGEFLNTKPLIPADRAIVSRVVAKYLGLYTNGISNELITKICNNLESGFAKFSVQKNIYCSCSDNRLKIYNQNEQAEPKTEFSIKIEVLLKKDLQKTQKVNNLFLKNAFDYDKISGELVLRTRFEGDKIKLAARPNKSLKKLFNENKIPLNIRSTLPVLADDKGVIWVYSLGVAERVKVNEKTEKVGVLRI